MKIQRKLLPLHKLLHCEANPIPLKWAMARIGLCGEDLRLPLTALSGPNQALVERAMRVAGLLA